jgi:hypothetical protein
MRKTLTLIALVCSVFSLKAQLVRTDLPDVGDGQVYRKADTSGVVDGPSGSGQSWDYTGLIATSAVGTNRYIVPSTHPQGGFFASANLCFSPANDVWAFYESSVDSIYSIGEKSVTNTRCAYTDGAAWYRFPQAFGVPNTDSVEGTYPDGFISSVTRKGLIMTTFDADGSLITPFATYPSVKRVELIAIHRDSSWTGVANSDVFIKRYEWYASTQTMPVLIINHQQIILNGGNPQVSKDVWWADDNATAIDEPFAGKLSISPNPSNGQARLQYTLQSDQNVTLEVLSIVGERVRIVANELQSAGSQTIDLNLNDIAKGIYFVKLKTAEGSATEKLVIE